MAAAETAAVCARIKELAEWMDDGDETFILRMSDRVNYAADLRHLLRCAEAGAQLKRVGWMVVDDHGERLTDEMYVSSEVALAEWPSGTAIALLAPPLAAVLSALDAQEGM